jgi:hypothetical protein
MTDREFLELAAKAAGIDLEWDGPPELWTPVFYKGKTYHGWSPLTDDGDALRLVVKLGMAVSVEYNYGGTSVIWGHSGNVRELHGGNPEAATRRAIVRAAAEIGMVMP